MKLIAVASRLAALGLLLAVAELSAACELTADRITLPRGWSAAAHDEYIQYRSPRAGQALTVALYMLEGHRAAGLPDAAMLELAELRRQRERELSGAALRLSALQKARVGPSLRLHYSGEDRGSRRRFVNLMLGSPGCVRNYYYEALDLSAPAFRRLADRLLGAAALQEAPAILRLPQLPPAFWDTGAPPVLRKIATGIALP